MSEESLHIAVCQYLKLQYPHVIFNTDLSGLRLPIGLAKKAAKMRSSRAFPDIVVYEKKGEYSKYIFHALFLELKKEGTKIFRRNGKMVADKHIREQARMMELLRERGYYAAFAIGFDEARRLIDWYLSDFVTPKRYIK